MIRVCAWCYPEKDAKGSTIGEVMGCSTETKDYNCVDCECVAECQVKRDWKSYTPEQRFNCSATHGLCAACMSKQVSAKS